MQLESLSWFPGHMTKTRRMVASEIGSMDAVCEIIDARIPRASRNPDLDELTAGKPRIVVLNRVDQADPKATKQWAAWFRAQGYAVLEVDAKSGAGVKQFAPAVRALLADKLRAYEEKGQVGRVLRVMVLGIPNVGKSTFINKVSGRKTAKAEDRPGVTRGKQWVPVDKTLELLDTPGHPLAEIRGPERGRAPRVYRRHPRRRDGYGGSGLPPDGVPRRALSRRADRALQDRRRAGRARLGAAGEGGP